MKSVEPLDQDHQQFIHSFWAFL